MRKRMSIPAALEGLRAGDQDLRARSLGFLLRCKGGDRVVTALIRAMDSPDHGLRSDAAYISGMHAAGYEVLVAHLRNDPSGSVRESCAEALSNDWYPGRSASKRAGHSFVSTPWISKW
jgi:HEAT repeat protein